MLSTSGSDMKTAWWDQLPDNYLTDFQFENGPKWLRTLALTPYFERFAYPIAIKRGLGVIWCSQAKETEIQTLKSWGWKVLTTEKTNEERFFEGSLALLTNHPRRGKFPRVSLTQWGRQRASRNHIHKLNGTYTYLKNGTLPTDF